MNLVNLIDEFALSNQISLRLAHFARGTSPYLDPEYYSTYTVNRMFCVLENPNGAQNFMGDSAGRHEFRPGSVYLAPAFHPVVFRLDGELLFISIHFNLELFHGIDLFSSTRAIYEAPMPEMIARLDECFRASSKMESALELKRSVYEIVMRFLRNYGIAGIAMNSRFSAFKPMLDHVASHCDATTCVGDLAKAMGLSREAFSRTFSSKTGISPKRFFDRQLAHRASMLLRRPRITAREVAYELKFSDEFVFSRFFKRQMGVSPRAFRRQYDVMGSAAKS